MKTRLAFDLDEQNRPIIEARLQESEDLRDKVAHRFTDVIGFNSNICSIYCERQSPDGVKTYTIRPISGLFIPYEKMMEEDNRNKHLIDEDLIIRLLAELKKAASNECDLKDLNSLMMELDSVRGYAQSSPYLDLEQVNLDQKTS